MRFQTMNRSVNVSQCLVLMQVKGYSFHLELNLKEFGCGESFQRKFTGIHLETCYYDRMKGFFEKYKDMQKEVEDLQIETKEQKSRLQKQVIHFDI